MKNMTEKEKFLMWLDKVEELLKEGKEEEAKKLSPKAFYETLEKDDK